MLVYDRTDMVVEHDQFAVHAERCLVLRSADLAFYGFYNFNVLIVVHQHCSPLRFHISKICFHTPDGADNNPVQSAHSKNV